MIINYSSLPLTVLGIIGFTISTVSIIYGLTIIIRKILDPNCGLIGWSSLIVAILLIGGATMFSLAIVGEYLRRILAEVSYAQPYIVEEMYV
ncbi:hypothetical protein [Methanolacinia petrolearia]|uniref:hypothetical protein n=1 Tax=Methanolacinia petrolearia TaxID=54120 RepID=UPI003BAB28AF